MITSSSAHFDQQYQTLLKHLKLKGLQPKTIEAYSRAIRRIGEHFEHQIDHLTEPQLANYFSELVDSHSWSTVKLDLYGLKFYYEHVLRKPWVAPGLIKPPRSQRLPDIVTVEEAKRIIAATRVPSYRVFFFTLYSLGLRLGEGLRLQVGCGPRPRAYPGCQRQQGSLRPVAERDPRCLARFLAVASQPRVVVPQSPVRFEGSGHCDHTAGSRRRAGRPASSGCGLRP